MGAFYESFPFWIGLSVRLCLRVLMWAFCKAGGCRKKQWAFREVVLTGSHVGFLSSCPGGCRKKKCAFCLAVLAGVVGRQAATHVGFIFLWGFL